ncbi:MAG: xanthine dehydrogenase family protein molybdopterin-binding subunit [Gemmatimonadales bacterium]|nr:xanthine dehydrogenase family protein molybdopterin-binding subunit [Gemmatimonadales bacterium]
MTSNTAGMERRDFVQLLGTGGLVLVVSLSGCRRLSDALRGAPRTATTSVTPAAYLRLEDTGTVTVICHRSEMGQGIRTSIAMIVADELEADWSRVKVEQALGDEKTYGSQNTDGSRSIRDFYTALRQAGATGRALLEAAAAKEWNVPASEVEARDHVVAHRSSGRKLDYGQLVATARDLPMPGESAIRLKQPEQFRYIGKDMPIVDMADMITGAAQYGMDLRREGMLVAVIARPPVYGGTVKSVDSTAAEKVAGVERVVRLESTPPPSGFMPLGGVAVLARNTWAAIQGRQQLRVEWERGPNATYDSAVFRGELERSVRRSGKVVRNQGDATRALQSASKRIQADYYIPHLGHAQMEPLAALATFENGKCDIWAPTQHPQAARDTVALALKIPVEDVRVSVTLLGGGFGRKSKPDFIVEAALLARETGKPVKVVWTREDDIQHDYFHTVAAQHLEGGLDASGKVTAWLHRTALPSIMATFVPGTVYAGEGEVGQGVTDLPFAVPNLRCENGPAAALTRIGWYRSVINIPHAFAIWSFADELAHAAGKDPKDFFLQLIGPERIIDMTKAGLAMKPWNYDRSFEDYPIDTARYRRVLELVADKSGWGKPLAKGRARGIAVHRSFLSYVATVIQVEVKSDGTVSIPRADVAIDAGTVVNPDRVRAQMEGATIMGIGNTLYGEISFKEGRPVQSNYTDYQVARIDAAPREFGVYIVPSKDLPGGVGEPGVPPVAPALCNAIFAATGRRIRSLPVAKQLVGGIASAG